MVNYTDNELVTDIARTALPNTRIHSATGYGSMLATPHMIKYAGRWHRVYAMIYGNSGSIYIKTKTEDLFIDSKTEWKMISPSTDPHPSVQSPCYCHTGAYCFKHGR